MSKPEKQQLDKERKSDRQLDREINLYIDIENSLKEKDIILLRKTLSAIISNSYSPNQNDKYKLKKPPKITAIAEIILAKNLPH